MENRFSSHVDFSQKAHDIRTQNGILTTFALRYLCRISYRQEFNNNFLTILIYFFLMVLSRVITVKWIFAIRFATCLLLFAIEAGDLLDLVKLLFSLKIAKNTAIQLTLKGSLIFLV